MKKQFKLMALASATMLFAACSQENLLSPQEQLAQNPENNAIQFGTYLSKQRTRAAAQEGNITSAQVLAQKGGFGVFAYYTKGYTYGQQQGATYTAETPAQANIAPNFMYNQYVQGTDAASPEWSYAPIKYWPNEFASSAVDDQTSAATGAAANGNVSFFAYAPYTDGTSLGSDGITAISAASVTGDPTVTYTIPSDINTGGDFVDLLWGTYDGTGTNVLGTGNVGVTGNKDATANTYVQAVLDGKTVNADLNKQKVAGKVGFNFIHALAKIGGVGNGTTTGFLVKLDIDDGTNETGGSRETFDAGSGSTDAWRTIVTIKSITITNDLDGSTNINGSEVGLGGLKVLNLATGQWSSSSSAGVFTQTIGGPETSTTYDAVLNTKIAEYQAAGTPDVTWLSHLGSSDVKDYFRYTNTENTSSTHPGVTETAQSVYNSATQSPIILFPGTTPSFKVTVTYVVRTYDANLNAKYSEVEQTITKTISFTNPVEMNKHYSLLMHLGLTGIKFTASVSDWETDINNNGSTTIEDAEDINLPINVQ